MAAISTERLGYFQLYLLQAHGAAIPIAVSGRTPGKVFDQSVAIDLFLDSVRAGSDYAAWSKKKVTVSDLAGKWHQGADSSDTRVDRYGNYAGSKVSAHGKMHKIESDGTYSYRYPGVFGGILIHEEGAGTVEIERDLITFRERRRTTRIHIE